MGTRTAARIAAQGDFLTLVHFLSGRYQNLAQMTVAGLLAVRVTDGDTVAVAAEPAGLDNGAATGGHNRRADGARPVHALVHPAPASLEA